MPTPPAPAWIRTVCPACRLPAVNRHSSAVPNATGTQAAAAASSPSGIGQVVIAGTARLAACDPAALSVTTRIANGPVAHTGAHLSHRAGREIPHDVRHRWRWRAGSGEQIPALDADRLNVDHQAAVRAIRIRDVLVAQDVRPTVFVNHRSFHGTNVVEAACREISLAALCSIDRSPGLRRPRSARPGDRAQPDPETALSPTRRPRSARPGDRAQPDPVPCRRRLRCSLPGPP